MKRKPLGILAVMVLLAVGATMAADSWIVREDGTGPVKVGMSLAQLNAVLHEKFAVSTAKDEQSCFYESPQKQPTIAFMILAGKLARMDVTVPGVQSSTGVQVGDSEAHALRIYGCKLKVEPHAYTGDEGGHYLTARSSDGRYGIRFETDGKKITTYYAGRFEAIQYIEGCE